MCGIAGIVNTRGLADKGILERMAEALRHRGPDAGGIEVGLGRNSSGGVSVGFSHRRLAIIDLSDAGRQPMCNEDSSVWITFNGEIYNYKELRSDLLARGHVFRSGSDTEVLVHGYEEYGERLPELLNGMFAYAIWDANREKLLLARDRFGKKPLYYREHPHGLEFASELTALLEHPDIPRLLDMEALGAYLLHEYVPAPLSMIEGVRKLPPGHLLVWSAHGVDMRPYWQPHVGGGSESAVLPQAARHLYDLVVAATQRRLMSDVPLGVFLSGGVDSSCLVAAMCECMDASKVSTFSIGFKERTFDESPYAREVARYFGTNHHEQILTAQGMIDLLPAVWTSLDEPLADASVIPTYLLSRFTRTRATVALGGDGSDELFAGYDPFAALQAADMMGRLPAPVRKALERLVSVLPVSSRNMSLDFKIKQFFKGLRHDSPVRLQAWMGAFCPEDQRLVLTEQAARRVLATDPMEPVRQRALDANLTHSVEAAIHYYLSWYLSGDILTKVDRASMAFSLEVRAPFLDNKLVEHVNALPANMKYRRGTRKFILREAFRHVLPPQVLSRSKKGFGIPLTAWLRKDLAQEMRRVFAPSRLKRQGLFRPEQVSRLVQEHMAGKVDNRKPLWTLFVYQHWHERVLERHV